MKKINLKRPFLLKITLLCVILLSIFFYTFKFQVSCACAGFQSSGGEFKGIVKNDVPKVVFTQSLNEKVHLTNLKFVTKSKSYILINQSNKELPKNIETTLRIYTEGDLAVVFEY